MIPLKTPEEVWLEIRGVVQARLAAPIFHSWFENIRVGPSDPGKLVLLVPNRFAKEWIEPRYLPLLSGAAAAAAGQSVSVVLEVDANGQQHGQPPVLPPPSNANRPALNPRYTFDTYVIGGSNRFAHAAALAVAEAPARAYNPLFIYGGVGLGKTHLLHAIGHYIQSTTPNATICYVSSEKFTNDFISAVGDPGRIAGFKRRYRENDVLLVDDIQFLERKEATIEEFFHTFNTLHDAGKQLVLTSDRPPKQLGLEERVRSHFEWGLITDVQPPDLETRIAILRKKAELEGMPHLSDEVLGFIASRVESNIRELEGALIRLIAFASLDHSQISVSLAETVLKDLYPSAGTAALTPHLILSETSRYFAIAPDELISPNRSRSLVTARQIAMYLCRELTDLSLPRIGDLFGGRDHTTVMHATTKIRGLMAQNRAIYTQIQELTGRIRVRAKHNM
ncbi:MAG: chromosomal replication initiator protein DnaA [Actinomycetota bacterium]